MKTATAMYLQRISSMNTSETTVLFMATQKRRKAKGSNRTKSKMKGLMEVESTYSRYRTLTHQKLPNYIERHDKRKVYNVLNDY
jgi:hypothetical protein